MWGFFSLGFTVVIGVVGVFIAAPVTAAAVVFATYTIGAAVIFSGCSLSRQNC
jgi:uncharacterized protein (DUF2062 family)